MAYIKKEIREQIYNKYDGRCAYCGKPITYKEMQVDHIKPIFRNWSDEDKERWLKGHYGNDEVENYNPSCHACNFRKGTDDIEGFRQAIEHGLECCRRDFTYRMMLRYGLVEEHPQKVVFYFEKCTNAH